MSNDSSSLGTSRPKDDKIYIIPVNDGKPSGSKIEPNVKGSSQ